MLMLSWLAPTVIPELAFLKTSPDCCSACLMDSLGKGTGGCTDDEGSKLQPDVSSSSHCAGSSRASKILDLEIPAVEPDDAPCRLPSI